MAPLLWRYPQNRTLARPPSGSRGDNPLKQEASPPTSPLLKFSLEWGQGWPAQGSAQQRVFPQKGCVYGRHLRLQEACVQSGLREEAGWPRVML